MVGQGNQRGGIRSGTLGGEMFSGEYLGRSRLGQPPGGFAEMYEVINVLWRDFSCGKQPPKGITLPSGSILRPFKNLGRYVVRS